MWAISLSSRFSVPAGWLSKLFSFLLLASATHAAYADAPCATGTTCDEGQAYSVCKAAIDPSIAYAISRGKTGFVRHPCEKEATTGYKAFKCSVDGVSTVAGCLNGDNAVQLLFYYGDSCASRPHQFNWKHNPDKPYVCHEGCKYESMLEIDIGENPGPAVRYYSSTGDTCTADPDAPPPEDCPAGGCPPDPEECPEGQSDPDGDGVCSPNDDDGGEGGQCQGNKVDPDGDGTCSCPAGQTDPDGDNTCTTPGDDDGEGECPEGEDCSGNGTSSGGIDCASEPVSTGGDALLHAVIRHSWLIRCGKSKTDANADGRPDWTVLKPGDQPPDDNQTEPETNVRSVFVGTSLLDTSGIVGGSSCPSLGTLDIGGWASISFDAEPWWCDLVRIMRAAILLMAAFTAVRILMGDNS